MNKRPDDSDLYHGKPFPRNTSLMDLYYEEEESSDTNERDSFGLILSHDDVKSKPKADITKERIDKDVTTEETKEVQKALPETLQQQQQKLKEMHIPEDIIAMIYNDDFYPFGCKGMKKNVVTTNRLIYLLQRMNIVTMGQCRAVTNDDNRRVYDIMNVLSILGIVEKIRSTSDDIPQHIKSKLKKPTYVFKFCSDVTTDNPIDLKELEKYLPY